MLVVELDEIFRGLLRDYDKFKIEPMFGQIIALLNARVNMPLSGYTAQVQPIRAAAMKILEENYLRSRSAEVNDFLSESQFGPILPANLAHFILMNLTEDPQRAGSVGEAQYKLEQFTRLRSLMNNFCSAVSATPLKRAATPKDEGTITLTVPDERFHGNIGLLGRRLEVFENFLHAVQLAANPDHPKPRLLRISTGSVVATLVASAIVAQSTIACFNAVVEATQQCINLMKAMKLLKDNGALPPDLVINQEFFQEQTKKIVDATLDGYLKQVEAQSNQTIDGEAKTRVSMSARFVVQGILGGAKISLDIGNTEQIALLDAVAPKEAKGAQSLIEMSRNIALTIKKIVDEAAPLLQISGPKPDVAPGVTDA